ncbi:MAG: permease [Dehalococcoidia bacterium]|nr:permease [Dehalococcoidia bacterium]
MAYWIESLERARGFLVSFFSPGVVIGLCFAFLLAGAINIFVPKSFVMKYMGSRSNKFLSYSIVIIAGIVLSV